MNKIKLVFIFNEQDIYSHIREQNDSSIFKNILNNIFLEQI